MKDGEVLQRYIENQKISKLEIAKGIGVTRRALYSFFDSSTLADETKEKFTKFFKEDIFKNTPATSIYKGDAKAEALEITIRNLSQEGLLQAQQSLIQAKNIDRLITILEMKMGIKGLGEINFPEVGAPGTTSYSRKNKKAGT